MDRPVIHLEMTDPNQLHPARPSPPIIVTEVSESAAALIGRLYNEIWTPLGGGGRKLWRPETWGTELHQPGVRTWLADFDGQPVGFAELEWRGDGNVAIVVIGIVPALQGKGVGGDFLTRMTSLAWQTPAPNGTPTARVWLWTSIPNEHPGTIPNYLARGYRQSQAAGESTA
ncbi:MAG: GNAT family N-acetyltransferase [Candidatus Dormiibacterota bacterium]